MKEIENKISYKKTGVWLQEALFFIASFVFFNFRVRPALIMESQSPVFLLDRNFFGEFLSIPGGIVDWLSALLMQFWFSDFIGVLILTILLWKTAFLTRMWMEAQVNNQTIHSIHLIPACLLLVLHSQYNFHISATIALIINLFFLILFIRYAPNANLWRMLLSAITSILLYWITGGAFLIFAILLIFHELLLKKRIANSIAILIIASVLPLLASSAVFLITIKQAYLNNLVIESSTDLSVVNYAFLLSYLLLLIIILLLRTNAIEKYKKKLSGKIKHRRLVYLLIWIIGTLILSSGTYLIIKKYENVELRNILEFNKAVKEERWQDAINTYTKLSFVNPLILFQTNIALYHTGVLLDKLFTYPQLFGAKSILLNFEWSAVYPEEVSNYYWHLGFINESLHWAHEAFEKKGPTASILKRLGMVYFMKGEYEAAKKYFLNLANVPFKKNEADKLLWLNDNPSEIIKDNANYFILSCMPTKNEVLLDKSFAAKMALLLERNPMNKMAYEYLIATYLLTGRLNAIMKNVPAFNARGYPKIPIHVQEAILIVLSLNEKVDLKEWKKVIDPYVFNRFLKYQQILSNYGKDSNRAKQELSKYFGDTYWYYFMFIGSSLLQTEEHVEYHK